jgi:hypothetical protein
MVTFRAGSAPGSLLLEPHFLLALFVLVFNDHVLKSAVPGFVTGKLSDVAGLAVAPVLAVSLGELLGAGPIDRPSRIRRLAFWAMATAVGFAAIQLCGPAARAYSHVLGAVQSLPRALVAWSTRGTPVWAIARHVADPTDLLALPFCAAGLACVALRGTSARGKAACGEPARPPGRTSAGSTRAAASAPPP